MSGVVWRIVNSTYHSRVQYSQLGYMLISCHCDFVYMYSVHVGWFLASQTLALCLSCSVHIVAQQANRYIVAFHIAISYDTQRSRYNRRVVGLCAACMVCVTLTDRCTRWPVHCSAWLQCVEHTEWGTCPGGGGGRVWCLMYRDTDSALWRLAQYTTTFSLAALGDSMD